MRIFIVILLFILSITVLISSVPAHTLAVNGNVNINPADNITNSQDFYVIIQSSYPGQAQELSLPLNSSGYIMYPIWNFLFFSDEGNTTYQLYLNGAKVSTGSFIFKTEYTMNISTDYAYVSIILTGNVNTTVYNFYNVPILHTTLGKYYTVSTIELPIYTLTQYLYFGVRTVVASLFSAIGAFFVINNAYVKRKKIEVYEK